MTNNAIGGCGNDLALDDITFRPCGPKVQAGISGNTASDTVGFCVDAQSSLTFNGAISTGYNAPRYQWQVSVDTGATWTDIAGGDHHFLYPCAQRVAWLLSIPAGSG